MRQKLAIIALLGLTASAMSIAPAGAQTAPVVLITEGIGKVCASADLRTNDIGTAKEKDLFGEYKPDDYESNGSGGWKLKLNATKDAWCNYPGVGYDFRPGGPLANSAGCTDAAPDPCNPGKSTHPQWWGAATGSEKARNKWAPEGNGLFLPGIGPGAVGPYSLNMTGSQSVPTDVCVDSIEGPSCKTRTVGHLKAAKYNGFGAHAGSSEGVGIFRFSTASGATSNRGDLGWANSAATILPLCGHVTHGNTGVGSQITGFTSSRGAGNEGNAGVQLPTTGFQVEGIIVQYTGPELLCF